MKITVIDYGLSNLLSVRRAFAVSYTHLTLPTKLEV